MDTKLIKNQISYWEGVLKEGEKQVKIQQEQNATIKATIKNLKALLPKEKGDDINIDPGLAETMEGIQS